jgi:hypothetical protein
LGGRANIGSFNLNIFLTLDWLIRFIIPTHPLEFTPKQLFTLPVLVIWFAVLFKCGRSFRKSDLFNLGVISMILYASLIEYHHLIFLLAPFFAVAVDTERGSSLNLFYGFCLGMILIQVDCLIETMFVIPAIPAQIGLLLMYTLYLAKIIVLNKSQSC